MTLKQIEKQLFKIAQELQKKADREYDRYGDMCINALRLEEAAGEVHNCLTFTEICEEEIK